MAQMVVAAVYVSQVYVETTAMPARYTRKQLELAWNVALFCHRHLEDDRGRFLLLEPPENPCD